LNPNYFEPRLIFGGLARSKLLGTRRFSLQVFEQANHDSFRWRTLKRGNWRRWLNTVGHLILATLELLLFILLTGPNLRRVFNFNCGSVCIYLTNILMTKTA